MVITVAAAALVARLVQLQVIDHSHYAAEARDIHVAEETVTGRRGALLDRNGYPLAASKDTYDVMVEVKAWKDGKAAAEAGGPRAGGGRDRGRDQGRPPEDGERR
jgi:cell division protein FtsI/penicillin-binding protein 2